MSNYKSIRLEEHVYLDLAKRQLPRESMSQVIQRLLKEMREIEDVAGSIQKILGEGL